MIPKKIHYIWFGKKNKSKLIQMCINSWKRKLTDYEIIEWNEDNINIKKICDSNKFFKKCYELKLWAFVSDYLRLYILYNEGGIYLDTDVEVIKKYDDLLELSVFMGFEQGGYIGTSVIGAESGNYLIKRLLEFYDEQIWNVDFYNNPIIFKYVLDTEPEVFNLCKIMDKECFSPYDPTKKNECIIETDETYSIHWYTNEWNMKLDGYVFLNTKHIKNRAKKLFVSLKKVIGYIKRNKKR